MDKDLIQIKKASYTLPKGVRVVPAGTYSSADFSTEEIEFLKSIGSLVIEEKATKPTRKKYIPPEKEEKQEDNS